MAAGRGEPELLADTPRAPGGLALEGRREGRRGQGLAFGPLRDRPPDAGPRASLSAASWPKQENV